MDKDLYDLPKEELKSIPTVCGSLREASDILVHAVAVRISSAMRLSYPS